MKRLFVLILAVALSACAYLPQVSSSPGADPFYWGINAYRGAHGAAPLAENDALVNKGNSVALWMASGGCGYGGNGLPNICHSSLASGINVPWNVLEENVGMICPASNPGGLESAFEHSPEHAANMLGPVSSFGVGIASRGDCLYVAEEFLG